MNVIELNEVDSTNDELKRRAEEGAENMTAVIAKSQTAGRGRHGREWKSPTGNLYASILLRDVEPQTAHQLALVAGLAALETVESYLLDSDPKLKWPNDVLVGGKKIAGILLESSGTGMITDYVIIGVGINIETAPTGEGINATSFREHGSSQNLDDVKDLFLDAFEEYLEVWKDFPPEGGFERIGNLWMQNAAFLDEEISVKTASDEIKGIFRGLNETGEMIIEKDGKEEIISSGEILS